MWGSPIQILNLNRRAPHLGHMPNNLAFDCPRTVLDDLARAESADLRQPR